MRVIVFKLLWDIISIFKHTIILLLEEEYNIKML